jgi:hypothetical protein
VMKLGQHLRFAAQPVDTARPSLLAQQLDRDPPTELGIDGLPDDPHAAATAQLHEIIATDPATARADDDRGFLATRGEQRVATSVHPPAPEPSSERYFFPWPTSMSCIDSRNALPLPGWQSLSLIMSPFSKQARV